MTQVLNGKQVEAADMARRIGTARDRWRRGWTTLFTRTTAFAALGGQTSTAILATPTALGGIIWFDPGDRNFVLVQAYGTGADNSDFALRIYGASCIDQDSDPVWVPSLWGQVQCQLGATTASVGGTSCRLAELYTLTLDKAPGSGGVQLLQPAAADDTAAQFVLDVAGSGVIGLEFTLSGASSAATGMGALWRAY